MTAKLLAAIFMALMLAAQASAQPSAPDARAIATCLKAAEDKGAFGGECIGVIADPCIAKARDTDKSVEASKACAARELAVWRELMRLALTRMKPGGKTVEVYELIINGQEISPGYSELNDPDVQRDRLEHQAGGAEEQKVDYDFIETLEHGMPPAGGIGGRVSGFSTDAGGSPVTAN